MRFAARTGQVLRTRAPEPVVLHSARLVMPVATEPVRDGAVVVRGDRVLQVGRRADLLTHFPVREERRWDGLIVAGLVDAYATALSPGVTAAACMNFVAPGVTYIEVTCGSEEAWEDSERDALITALREVDHPGPVGIAAHARDPHVLEDVAVLARTFGMRLLADLSLRSAPALDEAGVLGPHCHVVCSGPLDPGERKLLRLRQTAIAVSPGPGDALALLEERDPIALSLSAAARVRAQARALGLRMTGLDRLLVEAATLGGARALGMNQGPGRIGSLGPGSRADFAVFAAGGRYPYSSLLDDAPCLATVVGGATYQG
ncbi:imidazolonepropionase-like domain-containing protein [Nonomuraea sp. NPDC050556]|uniref:amidohydrolase family protein n=1 Tax=Nonomuraea sp. NPDC050556 TaxID=3364369 RepID=UPI00379160E4